MNGETRQQVSEKIKREARILNNMLIDQVCVFPPGIPPIPRDAISPTWLPRDGGVRVLRRASLKKCKKCLKESKQGRCCRFMVWDSSLMESGIPLCSSGMCALSWQLSDCRAWCFNTYSATRALSVRWFLCCRTTFIPHLFPWAMGSLTWEQLMEMGTLRKSIQAYTLHAGE